MKELWCGLDEGCFEEFAQSDDVSARQRILAAVVKESDIDYSHQRELVLDQLYSTFIFALDMGFPYAMTQSLLKLVVDEFGALMEEQYDMGAEQRLRAWISDQVNMETIVVDAPKLKKIAKFISTTMFGELETYHYALTHLPTMKVLRVPLYVDTPLQHLPPLA